MKKKVGKIIVLVVALLAVALFLAFGAEPLGQSVLALYYGAVFCLKMLCCR